MTTKPAPAAAPATPIADAVAGALGVELTDQDRAAYQLERPEPAAAPVTDPPAQDPPAQDPPAQDPPTPAAAKAPPSDPAPDPKAGDPAPEAITPEAIAKLLDGAPPADDGKTGVAELDDEIPADLNERTRTRMEALVTRGREQHQQLQESSAELEQLRPLAEQAHGWQKIVVGSGLEPQDFAAVMGTMAAVNRGTPEQKRVALGEIRKLYERVAQDCGEPLPGSDPNAALAGFPDLQAQVANLEITAAAALEIAQGRRARAAAEASAQQGREQQTRVQAYETAKATAITQLDALGDALAKRDGDAFHVRRHVALKAIQGTLATLHPSEWGPAFRQAYEAVPQAMVDATLAQLRGGGQGGDGAPVRRQTPIMRTGGGTGGGGGGGGNGAPRREAANAQDAVFAALGLPSPA